MVIEEHGAIRADSSKGSEPKCFLYSVFKQLSNYELPNKEMLLEINESGTIAHCKAFDLI